MRNFDPMPKPEDFTFTVRPGAAAASKAAKPKRMTKKVRQEVAAFFRSVPTRPSPAR